MRALRNKRTGEIITEQDERFNTLYSKINQPSTNQLSPATDPYLGQMVEQYDWARQNNPKLAYNMYGGIMDYMGGQQERQQGLQDLAQQYAMEKQLEQQYMSPYEQKMQQYNLESAQTESPIFTQQQEEQEISEYVSNLLEGVNNGLFGSLDEAMQMVMNDEDLTTSAKIKIRNLLQQGGQTTNPDMMRSYQKFAQLHPALQ